MKITRRQLKQIIKEELTHIMNEQGTTPNPTGAPRNWPDEEAEGVLARQLRLALKHNDMILYRYLKTSDQPYLDAYWLEAAAQRERDYDNAQQSAEFEQAFEAGKTYYDNEGTYHPHPPPRPGRAGYEIQKDDIDHDHMADGYPAPAGYARPGQSWEELNPDEGRQEQVDERKKSKSRYCLYKAGTTERP